MAKLILKEFRCVEDTDEVGAESPYFLVFVGDLETGKTTLKMIRQGNWHNEVDKGELWVVNATVTNGFSFKPKPTLVLVAMVEEDENLDISSFERDNMIAPLLAAKFKSFRDSGSTVITGGIESGVRNTFETALALTLSNDDNMGIKRLNLNGQTGEQDLVKYSKDDGFYKVRFTIQ